MQWLTPTIALFAGAITVPSLLILYFLKLKRRELPVSCTLLWQRAAQDLWANAPFQRLRRNILLLMQLLALLAVVAALGSPMMAWQGGGQRRYVLLIDRSASMGANDVQPSRLAAAKQQAREFVGTLRQGAFFGAVGQPDEAMIISFADRPQVVCTFTSNRNTLLRGIDSIGLADGTSRLQEAVRIGTAFATPVDPEAMGRSSAGRATFVLFTDGRLHDADEVTLRDEEVVLYQIGRSSNNLAITAVEARRRYEDPEEVTVFANLANFGESASECDVQLSLDGRPISYEHVVLPAVAPASASPDTSQAGVTFTLRSALGGVLEVRQLTSDALAADDAAWMVVPRPKRLSVLLVSPGNLVLEEALRSLPMALVETKTPDEIEATPTATLTYDVIVLDRSLPKQLPRGAYLVFGPPPPSIGVTSHGPNQDQFILDWRMHHPATRFVNLQNVFAKEWWQLDLPDDAHVLAEADRGPCMAMLSRGGSSYLLVNFDILSSNWPFRPGFVMFLYNAVGLLGRTSDGGADRSSMAVGSSFIVEAPPATDSLRVVRPDGQVESRPVDASGRMRYADLDRVGVYRVQRPNETEQAFAVNLLDADESNIAPAEQVNLGGRRLVARHAGVTRANIDLRPWLAALALMVLCLEWYVYNRKVQI